MLKEVFGRILDSNFVFFSNYKIYNKLTTTENCFHHLFLLSIEKDKSEELIKCRDEILNELTCEYAVPS